MLTTYALYVWLSVKNRILMRLRRLKQPRYLVGLVVGLLYFAFAFGRGRHPVTIGGRDIPIDPSTGIVFLTILAAALMILCWALPESEAGLDLSETEALFLFPAPITRGQLFGFVITRSLFPQLLSTLVMKVFFLRSLNFFGLLAAMIALQIYFLMVKIARARLRASGIGFISRAAAVLLVLAILVGVTYAQYAQLIPELTRETPKSAEAAISRITAGPMQALPLSAIYFVPALYAKLASSSTVATAALPLLLVASLTLLFGWVAVRLDVSYEEATIAKARRRAARREARLNRDSGLNVSKRSPIHFPLDPVGRPEIAIVWKNSTAAARSMLLVFLLPIAIVAVATVVVTWKSSAEIAFPIASALALALAAFVTLLGPLMFRNDLRTDLPRLDVLRAYPLNGRQLVAAEIASPALLLFGLQATCLIAGVATSTFGGGFASGGTMLGWGVLALLFAMPLTVIQLLVHNGLVVLFPAWASFSKEDQRGIEAFGRRLLLLLAQLITLVVGLLPAAAMFAVAFLISRTGLTTVTEGIVVATVPALMTLAFEIYWTVTFLGDQLDRIDVSDNMAIVEAQ